ncbi:hypothetical protein LCGC14_1453030 [marine sediment metagenome]|uniref:Helix-hairpin-helix domain-containing protein n=1 Tax=marine sediment metagenome TaxID=412755 RepID=A0A0F9JI06_9ZZZZ
MTDTHENLIKNASRPQVVFDSSKDVEEETDENEEALSPSVLRENLTIIKGIGSKNAEKLNKAGIFSIEQLSNLTVEELSKVDKIGLVSARKMIEGAKSHLETFNLVNFSQAKPLPEFQEDLTEQGKELDYVEFEEEDEINDTIDSTNIEAVTPSQIEENLPLEHSHSNTEEPNIQEYEQEAIDFNEEYDNVIPEEIDDKVPETHEVEVEEDIPRDIEVQRLVQPQVSITPDLESVNKAVLDHQEMQFLSQKTCIFLKKNEFHIIQKNSDLQKVYHGIDILALKVIRIKETREVICVIPIKLNGGKGPLVVSSDKITRNMKGNNASSAINRKLDSYATTLYNSCTRIRDNLGDEGTLFAYLNHNLKLNLTVERTRSHKNLYLRSGPVHYKLVVTPILVSQHKVGFTEKVLSFAYQKDLDLHVVELMNFSHLLQYLDLKYFQIETFNKEQSTITLNNEGSVKLMTLVRKSSIIFMGLGLSGILFLVFALLQGFPVLVVNSLGYGAIFLYMIILGYFYLANYRRKSLIHRKFERPYHKRNLILDDASLVLIREELPPKLMEQFVYESLDTKYKSKVITNIKLDGAQDFIRKKSLEKEVNEDTLFEKKDKNKEETSLDGSLLKKYNTFIED